MNKPQKKYRLKPINLPDPAQALKTVQTQALKGVQGVQGILKDLTANLTSTISQLTNRAPEEDYFAIAKGFMPSDARVLTPQYPGNSKEYLLADLDGDKKDELVASYRLSDTAVRTIILKKTNDKWNKAQEFNVPEYDSIHYRNVVDMAGQGKKQLVLGLASKGKVRALHGYSLGEGSVKKLFAHNYHKLEVLGLPGKVKTASKPQFAMWNDDGTGIYDIQLLGWNGTQLEQQNADNYYSRKVIPYYASRIKREPGIVAHWYNLADTLRKTGAYTDAKTIVEYGMKADKDSLYKQKFTELQSKL